MINFKKIRTVYNFPLSLIIAIINFKSLREEAVKWNLGFITDKEYEEFCNSLIPVFFRNRISVFIFCSLFWIALYILIFK